MAGCATVVKVSEYSTTEPKIGMVPTIGVQSTTPVGGIIYSQFRYWSKTGYRIKSDFSQSFVLGRISVLGGDFVLKSELGNKDVFCTEKKSYIDPMIGPYKTACFIDNDKDSRFERLTAAPGAVWFEYDIAQPLPYEISELIIPNNDSFKYEILYQGINKGSLKLSYREYINDFARPAFFQDVTYDLESTPTTITFRTVRLEISGANNNQINYRVLSGF
jgi:hypothetical protein